MCKFLFLVAAFVAPSLAIAKGFLSYQQVLQLSPSQQEAYVKDLQQLVLSLSDRFEGFESSRPGRTPSTFLPIWRGLLASAHASSDYRSLDGLCQVSLSQARQMTRDELLSKIEMISCSESTSRDGPISYFRPVVPDSLVVLTDELRRRIENGDLNPRSNSVSGPMGGLRLAISELKKRGVRGGGNYQAQMAKVDANIRQIDRSPSPSAQLPTSPTQPRQEPRTKTTHTNPARANPPVPPVIPTTQTTVLAPRPSQASVPALPAPAVKTVGTLIGQCLYAGFVIPREIPGCQPFQSLPENLDSAFFGSGFQCQDPSEILCNPLLFGYTCEASGKENCVTKKPVCSRRSKDATKNCYDLAGSQKTTARVTDILKSPNGEKMYREFTASLESLCDDQELKKRKLRAAADRDIRKTCSQVFDIFSAHINEKYLPAHLKPGSSRPSTGSQ